MTRQEIKESLNKRFRMTQSYYTLDGEALVYLIGKVAYKLSYAFLDTTISALIGLEDIQVTLVNQGRVNIETYHNHKKLAISVYYLAETDVVEVSIAFYPYIAKKVKEGWKTNTIQVPQDYPSHVIYLKYWHNMSERDEKIFNDTFRSLPQHF